MSQDTSKDGRPPLRSSLRQSIQSFLLPRSPTKLLKEFSVQLELNSTGLFSIQHPQSSGTTESFSVNIHNTPATDPTATPTRKEDFADSETSQEPILSAAEVAADAETIYSIIRDYDLTHEFLFDEDFNTTTESGTTAKETREGSKQPSQSTLQSKDAQAHDTTLFSNASNLENVGNSPAKLVTVSRSEMPSLINMQQSSLQILSTNLSGAGQGNPGTIDLLENLTIGLSSAARVSVTTPMQPEFSAVSSQRVSLANLLGEDKSNTSNGLKSTEHLSQSSPFPSAYQSNNYIRDTIDSKDYSEVFSSLSIGTVGEPFPFETRPSGAELLTIDPEYGKSVHEASNPATCYRIPILGANEPGYSPTIPNAFPTRDSMEKLNLHRSMFSDYSQESIEPQIQPNLIYSWTKWGFMMATALVVVPVFFLLALGMLDKKGFYYHDFDTPNEKATINLSYHQRYSAQQKCVSLVLGVLWVAIILAMIGVGFGLGLTRLPS